MRMADEQYLGCLMGLVVGDAVGTAVEFKKPGTFPPVIDMRGGGPFFLRPGQWTDDTSMALCLATSLVEMQAFDAADQMRRYLRWWREGYFSSNGRCFDIGGATSVALSVFERTGEVFAGSEDPKTAGNGSVMRLAPVPMWYAADMEQAITYAAESSRTTHGARAAVDACRYLAAIIVGLLQGRTKSEVLDTSFAADSWQTKPLCPEIEAIRQGSYRQKTAKDLLSGGYVVETLEAALWGFANADTFEEGCLQVVNLGNDADTAAAVYGQIAGAHYGLSGIPAPWVEKVSMREEILALAEKIAHHAMREG